MLESVVEEEDYDQENTSNFKLITNLKKRYFTIGLHYGRVNLLPSNFKFPKEMRLFQLVTVISTKAFH